MMNCKSCMFHVSDDMRYSLVKNCCPSCGHALLGDVHMGRLKLLTEKINNQKFAQELCTDTVFDIALFMLIDFYTLDDNSEHPEEGAEEGSDPVEGHVQTLDDIRNDVRAEMTADDEEYDEESDLKIARLKRIAKETSSANKPGAIVRRVTD
jgi:hypothetical protein